MPRSILKRSSHSDTYQSYSSESGQLVNVFPYPPQPPQVHFPPSPSLTQTYTTYSVKAYDRAPITVTPNACALPARGCPGRTYDEAAKSAKAKCKQDLNGRHPHPRVTVDYQGECSSAAAARNFPSPSSLPPPYHPPLLVPDLSSESDESDGAISPPEYGNGVVNAMSHVPFPYPPHSLSSPPSQEQLDKALSFLPYAPPPKGERDMQKRHCSGVKRRNLSPTRYKSEVGTRSFAASSLDGCLGGF